jgi:hypothetical protein
MEQCELPIHEEGRVKAVYQVMYYTTEGIYTMDYLAFCRTDIDQEIEIAKRYYGDKFKRFEVYVL